MKCDGCGAVDVRHIRSGFCKNEAGERVPYEVCEICTALPNADGRATDANGDKIVWDDSLNGKYNYCLGEVIHSKRHLSDILKKHDMMQKGDFVNKKDGRWAHVRDTGRPHAGRK
jgi:hypothetical protein